MDELRFCLEQGIQQLRTAKSAFYRCHSLCITKMHVEIGKFANNEDTNLYRLLLLAAIFVAVAVVPGLWGMNGMFQH